MKPKVWRLILQTGLEYRVSGGPDFSEGQIIGGFVVDKVTDDHVVWLRLPRPTNDEEQAAFEDWERLSRSCPP